MWTIESEHNRNISISMHVYKRNPFHVVISRMPQKSMIYGSLSRFEQYGLAKKIKYRKDIQKKRHSGEYHTYS